MDGEVGVDPREPQGSRFWVQLAKPPQLSDESVAPS
jgi:hypothetical protein